MGMSREEAKEIFLNRGFIKVDGGIVYDGNKWRDACIVISEWLKSLEQEPKTGHWVKIYPYPLQMHDYECSECGHETDDNTENYCSNCGAKMVKLQESEE